MPAALVLSIVAIVLAAGSLAWQITIWIRARARLTVRVGQPSGYPIDRPMGVDDYVFIVVSNAGRLPTSVLGFGFENEQGASLRLGKIQEPQFRGDALPTRLEAGGSATYSLLSDTVPSGALRVWVEDANGKKYRSAKGVGSG